MSITMYVIQHIETSKYAKGKPFPHWDNVNLNNGTSKYLVSDLQKACWFRQRNHAPLALRGFDKTKFRILEIA